MSKRSRRPGPAPAGGTGRRNTVSLPPGDTPDLAFQSLIRYPRSSPDAQHAAEAARADVRAAAEQITRIACGRDLIRVVGNVRAAMIMQKGRTGDDPPAALLELLVLILAHRDVTRTGAATGTDYMPSEHRLHVLAP